IYLTLSKIICILKRKVLNLLFGRNKIIYLIMNKKLKVYLDTSVINFLYSEQSLEKREITIEFFE
nr:hypothetical protein [Candidatus Kapabacteria bacterium]